MIRLIKDNVERLAADDAAAVRLEKAGFARLDPPGEGKVGTGQDDCPDLDAMTAAQLKALAKERGISGASSLTKAELLELMRG